MNAAHYTEDQAANLEAAGRAAGFLDDAGNFAMSDVEFQVAIEGSQSLAELQASLMAGAGFDHQSALVLKGFVTGSTPYFTPFKT